MPQIAALSLADGQTTPVSKTFDVGSAQMGTTSPAAWYERSNGSFSGYRVLTQLVRRANGSKSTKVSVRLVDPKLDVTGNVAYSTFVNIEFTLPDSCTLQDRKDILAFAKNYLATTMVQGAVHDTSPAY